MVYPFDYVSSANSTARWHTVSSEAHFMSEDEEIDCGQKILIDNWKKVFEDE